MNLFDELLLDEPPLGIDPDAVLAEGRARLRRRRLVGAVGTSAVLAAGALAIAVPALPGLRAVPPASADPAARPTGATATTGTTHRAGPPLSEKNLRDVVERALGHRLDQAAATRDPSGKEDLVLSGSYRGKRVSVSVGAPSSSRTLTCETDLGYSPGVPCRIERLTSGAVMRVAQLTSPGGLDNLVDVVRPDGLRISVGCQNVSPQTQEPPRGQPPLTLDQLRAAAMALDAGYTGRSR